MKFRKSILFVMLLVLAPAARANPEKVPNETGAGGDRVECDLSGMIYYEMSVEETFDNTGGPMVYGPLGISVGATITDVVLQVDIDQTWIGDLVIDLYYDEDGNGSFDYGPVSALCRPNLDGCPYDDCCGCSGNVSGVYTFGDGGAPPMGEPDCPSDIPNGCYEPAPESPAGFQDTFGGAQWGGDFWLEIADGAAADETTLHSWGVHVGGNASELLVKDDGTGDVPTIQDAIDIIAVGGTIYLDDGVYTGEGNYALEFYGKDLTLRSLSLDPENCVIDCQGVPGAMRGGKRQAPARGRPEIVRDRELRVDVPVAIYLIGGEGPDCLIRGIKFVNAYNYNYYGGAIYIWASSPTIQDCVFESDYCEYGGGAIGAEQSSPTIKGCTFNACASYWGGAVEILGPGSNASIEDCLFLENWSIDDGGALNIYDGAHVHVEGCRFLHNTSGLGGAVSHYYGSEVPSADFRYCTFSENFAGAGGVFYANSPFTSWFNILSFSTDGATLAWDDEGLDEPVFACTNIFGNVEGDWTGILAPLEGVDGNISADPQYCGMLGTWDVRLQSDSPCLPDYTPCADQYGALGQGCGEAASQSATWSKVKSLY